VRDLGLLCGPAPGELQEHAWKIRRRLLNLRCAALVRDEALRTRERNDEFWYLGEEVATYRRALELRPDAAHQQALERVQARLVNDHDLGVLDRMIDEFGALSQRP